MKKNKNPAAVALGTRGGMKTAELYKKTGYYSELGKRSGEIRRAKQSSTSNVDNTP